MPTLYPDEDDEPDFDALAEDEAIERMQEEFDRAKDDEPDENQLAEDAAEEAAEDAAIERDIERQMGVDGD